MASRQQIERLSQRIDALVVSKVPTCAVIRVGAGENEEAAIEQHYRNHPQDREASHTIIVQFVAAKNGRPVEAAR
jgi:hypothetical protein